jgi:hypothetical protein
VTDIGCDGAMSGFDHKRIDYAQEPAGDEAGAL